MGFYFKNNLGKTHAFVIVCFSQLLIVGVYFILVLKPVKHFHQTIQFDSCLENFL